MDFDGGELRNQCSASMLLPIKKVICWSRKTNQTGCFLKVGARALKVRDTTILRTSCDMFRELLASSAWYSKKKKEFDELMVTKKVFALGLDGISYSLYGVRVEDGVRNFSLTHSNMLWRVHYLCATRRA